MFKVKLRKPSLSQEPGFFHESNIINEYNAKSDKIRADILVGIEKKDGDRREQGLESVACVCLCVFLEPAQQVISVCMVHLLIP